MEATQILLTAAVISISFLAFSSALYPAPKNKKKKKKGKKKAPPPLRIYCLECEIEMPVKEKNGRLYCTNCKLIH